MHAVGPDGRVVCTPGLALRALALLLVGMLGASEGTTQSLDVRLLQDLYHAPSPVLRGAMNVTQATANPLLLTAPALQWGVALADGGPAVEAAYRTSVAWVATTGLVLLLKPIRPRLRPYRAVPGIRSRSERYNERGEIVGRFSFPSGHTALAFGLATSWTYSRPGWLVAAPAFTWATAVGLSRVWMGVHYPSDVLAGALLGTGIAALVHTLGDRITPAFLREEAEPVGPMLRIVVPLR
ncbi:MAG: phosphatase PAP2 family protein [Bacteroidota bacterium]